VTKLLADWKKDNNPYDYLAQLRAMLALGVAPNGGAGGRCKASESEDAGHRGAAGSSCESSCGAALRRIAESPRRCLVHETFAAKAVSKLEGELQQGNSLVRVCVAC
jgi:hypothetical protein